MSDSQGPGQPSQQQPAPSSDELVAEDDYGGDNDSAVDTDSRVHSETWSIPPSLRRSQLAFGRRYQSLREGAYLLPNDDDESQRLDLQHYSFLLSFNGGLHLCPAGEANRVHRVLDAGTGTGIWAIDYADDHPEVVVIGVDLSPIQPRSIPPNVEFFVDDLEMEWEWHEKFDFIHTRMLTGSIKSWPDYFAECFKNLNPSGFVEVSDIVLPVRSHDDSMPADSALLRWSSLMAEGASNLGRRIDSAVDYADQLRAAGFVGVVERTFEWPANGWPGLVDWLPFAPAPGSTRGSIGSGGGSSGGSTISRGSGSNSGGRTVVGVEGVPTISVQGTTGDEGTPRPSTSTLGSLASAGPGGAGASVVSAASEATERERQRELGEWMLENLTNGLEALSLVIFTNGLGWSHEDLDEFLDEVKRDMADTSVHAYFQIIVVYGQKPGE